MTIRSCLKNTKNSLCLYGLQKAAINLSCTVHIQLWARSKVSRCGTKCWQRSWRSHKIRQTNPSPSWSYTEDACSYLTVDTSIHRIIDDGVSRPTAWTSTLNKIRYAYHTRTFHSTVKTIRPMLLTTLSKTRGNYSRSCNAVITQSNYYSNMTTKYHSNRFAYTKRTPK